MLVIVIDWISFMYGSSSVNSSMIASMDRFWLMTAVQMIFLTPKATSTSLQFSDHLSPSLTTFVWIDLKSAFKSCSASQGLISRLQSDRWFASFFASFAMAFALASSSSLAAAAFSSGVWSSSSPQKSSSSSSSAAGAGAGAALGAGAGALAFLSALAAALASFLAAFLDWPGAGTTAGPALAAAAPSLAVGAAPPPRSVANDSATPISSASMPPGKEMAMVYACAPLCLLAIAARGFAAALLVFL
mmetsp:Transcript_27376/g.84451  ORF Transcript_27376/g.84451 Transcript_27376/m.84451 type:complete len:246 (-) Transcript_27376:401-1138(-)